ncbi:MAG: dicarboxylate/amino acid:cation symporter [Clostridium sp.]|nr:dicarboxylate/amino acid:cation symporter [Clostridium sp.]
MGIFLGIASYELPEAGRLSLLGNYIEPTLNTILSVITAVAVPMVFFSLTWGVCTIGDVNTLSRIGKRMIGRFMLFQLLLAAVASAVCVPFFHGSSAGGSSFQPAEIYALLLSIIPDNLVTPFTTGNTVHVITLAVVAGSVLLLMGERVSSLTLFVDHMNKAMFYLMSGVSALIPFMVFFGLFKITASGQLSVVLRSWKMLVTILALFILPMLIYTILVAVRKGFLL